MNDLISKWNKEIKHIEQETEESVDMKRYINDKKDITIIDLKYLSSINKSNLINDIEIILVEYRDVLKDNRNNTYPCLYYININDKDKCKKYSRCLLCKLDYLIDVKRIMIRKKV